MARIKTTKGGTPSKGETASETHDTPHPPTTPKKVKIVSKDKKRIAPKKNTKSIRAGIIFPSTRTQKFLRSKSALNNARVGPTAGIFLASVLEYLTAEVLELAGDQAHALGAQRINERFIKLAVEADSELDQLFKMGKVSILGGGATPTLGIVKRTPSSKNSAPKPKKTISKDGEAKKTDEDQPKKKKEKKRKAEEGEPKEKKEKKKKTTTKKKKSSKEKVMDEGV